MPAKYIRSEAGEANMQGLSGAAGIQFDETALALKVKNPATGTVHIFGQTKQPVISGSGATVALTAAQSGSLCLFDRALGIVFTLPAAAAGLFFDFYTSVTITGGAAEVITYVGTVFMGGTIVMALEASTPGANPGPKFFTGNGTSHVKISSNGSTTGGILGSKYRVQCDGVNWFASGICLASSTIATPFA